MKYKKIFKYLISKYLPLSLRFGGAGVSFISGVIISRFLGVKDSGVYYIALNIISILAVLANFGNNTVILKKTSNKKIDKNDINELVLNALHVSFIISLILSLIIFICWIFIKNLEVYKCVLIMCPSIFFMAVINNISSYLQAKKKFPQMIILQSFGVPFVMCLFTAFYLLINNNIKHLNGWAIISGTYVIIVFLFFCFALKEAGVTTRLINRKCFKPSFEKSALRYLIVNLVLIILAQGILLISGHILNVTEMSKIIAAQKIAILFNFISTSIIMFHIPTLVDNYHNERDKFKIALKKCTNKVFLLNLPIIIIFMIFSNEIMKIYGSGFEGSDKYFLILCVGQIINSYCSTFGGVYLLVEQEQKLVIIYIISVVISILSTIILPYCFKPVDIMVAVSIALSLMIVNAISYIKLYKLSKNIL